MTVLLGRFDDKPDGGVAFGDGVGVDFPLQGFIGAAAQFGHIENAVVEVHDGYEIAGGVGGIAAIVGQARAGEDPVEGREGGLGFDLPHQLVGREANEPAVFLEFAGDVQQGAVRRDAFAR